MRSTKLQPHHKITKRNKQKLKELNPQQRMFIHHLLARKDFNMKQAAAEAGYKLPSRMATQLINTPHIAQAIAKEIWDRKESLKIDAAQVLQELAYIGFSNPKGMFKGDGSLMSITEMPDELARAIASVEIEERTDRGGNVTRTYKVRFWSKIAALELVAKHLGMLDERLMVQHGIDTGTQDSLHRLLDIVESRGNNVIDSQFVDNKITEVDK